MSQFEVGQEVVFSEGWVFFIMGVGVVIATSSNKTQVSYQRSSTGKPRVDWFATEDLCEGTVANFVTIGTPLLNKRIENERAWLKIYTEEHSSSTNQATVITYQMLIEGKKDKLSRLELALSSLPSFAEKEKRNLFEHLL
jgi:hypothetical protein